MLFVCSLERHPIYKKSVSTRLATYGLASAAGDKGNTMNVSEMLEDKIDQQQDWEKVEVRNYQSALKLGVEAIQTGYPLTEHLIREMHKVLMQDARGSTSSSGEYRKIQNFIGPTKHIKDASYIPPEPQLIGEYMKNLERYMNGHPYQTIEEEPLHPLIKAAIIHGSLNQSTHS